nr:hypothetical protein [Lysinibacillus timonensis]
MDNIIEYEKFKRLKLKQQAEKLFSKADSLSDPEKIRKLIEQVELTPHDHKMFLAYLTFLDREHLTPASIFKDLCDLPRIRFEAKYTRAHWESAVYMCWTWLTIIKQENPEQYEQFLSQVLS